MHAALRIIGRSAAMPAAMAGVLWTIVSACAFVGSNAIIRFAGQRLPPFELALVRSAAGLILVLVAWRVVLRLRELRDPWIHVLRGAIGAVSLFAIVHAFTSLPMALATAVLYSRVLLVIPIAWLFLGERVQPGIWAAAGIGFTGVIVALLPQLTGAWTWGVASVVLAAVASAGSHVVVRRLARTNPTSVIVLVASVLISIILVGPAAAAWQPIRDAAIPLVAGMALVSVVAQWTIARAYSHASPAYVGPVTLIEVPLAALAGWALFGEIPTLHTAAGAALIVGSALYVTASESRA